MRSIIAFANETRNDSSCKDYLIETLQKCLRRAKAGVSELQQWLESTGKVCTEEQ